MVDPAGRTRISRSGGTTWVRREAKEQTKTFTEGGEGNEGWTRDFRDDTDAGAKRRRRGNRESETRLHARMRADGRG